MLLTYMQFTYYLPFGQMFNSGILFRRILNFNKNMDQIIFLNYLINSAYSNGLIQDEHKINV